MSGGFIGKVYKPDKPVKPVFIILLGPTGVGKTEVLSTAYQSKYRGAVKIEKDKYITDQKLYNESVYNLVYNKSKEKIIRIIENGTKDEKIELTDEFNKIYHKTNNSICYNIAETCYGYHDDKLTKKILQKRNIVLEMNGANNFEWVFNMNDTKDILNNEYDIKLLYLSSDYNKLLMDNKKRFLKGLEACNEKDCRVRLTNFLLEDIYKRTIINIFETHESFPIDNYPNIERVYWRRNNDQYIKLNNFEEYKKSFNLNFTDGGSKKNNKKKRRHTKRRRYTKRRRAGKSS